MKKISKVFLTVVLTLTAALCLAFMSSAVVESKDGTWVGAWSTAPTQIGIKGYEYITAELKNVTCRSVIVPTASGTKVRVRFSNYYGDKPLTIDSATIANCTSGANIDMSSIKVITFNDGSPLVTIPAGKEVYSDEINFKVQAMQEVAISIYAKNLSEIKTAGLSGSRSYLAFNGDQTRTESFSISTEIELSPLVKQLLKAILGFDFNLQMSYSFIKVTPVIATLDVYAEGTNAYTVAVVGDSTISNEFPQYLGEEIFNQGATNIGVIGKGIIGNRLGGEGLGYGSLIFGESMLDRLERDVISQSGVKYAIIKIGANDIMHPVCNDIKQQYPGIKQPTAQDIINDYKTAFKMLHNAGIKVIVIGITQWKGNTRDYLGTGGKYIRTEAEFKHDWQIALDVNEWLATTAASQGLHDGYVNFNDISANPEDPDAFLPEYTIDGAHPSDLLQHIWAQNFPLSLLGISKRVGNVRLNKSDITLSLGKSEKLTSTVLPSDAVNKNVSWSSTNEAVAVVDSNGLITAKGGGKCEIICKSDEDPNITAKCTVIVTVPVTGVQVTPETAEIYTTKTVKLSASVYPDSATSKKIEWMSGNEKVATVDKNGVVTGVGSGKASIICKTVDGGYTSMCEVTVLPKINVEKLALSKTSTTIRLGKTDLLSCSVIPANATFKNVSYKSSNTKIVTVDSYGLIRTVGTGSAVITVTSLDNSFATAKCKVNVVVDVTGLKLNKNVASVYAGNKLTLVPTIYPLNATNKKVKWLSSDERFATVDSNGTVTAKRAGTVVITCETLDGHYVDICTLTIKKVVKTKSVSLNKLSCAVYVGRTRTLVATVLPENATDKRLIWKSSNPKVATVNSKGVVTGVRRGTATITCTTRDTGKKVTCEVKVVNVKVKSISLSKTSANLTVKKTLALKCIFNPADTTIKDVTWTSSNPKVAKVNANGKVTAVAPGTAVITCKTKYGNQTAKCTVKVSLQKIKSVSFKNTEVELLVGKKMALKPVIKPAGATGAKLKWRSSDPTVVKVNSNGTLTALKAGKAYITCKPNDGSNAPEAVVLVTVTKRDVLGVKLNKNAVQLSVKGKLQLKATVVPEDATDKRVKWESSNTKVAKVNSKGTVTAVGKGVCMIRAITVDGNYIAMCMIVVS